MIRAALMPLCGAFGTVMSSFRQRGLKILNKRMHQQYWILHLTRGTWTRGIPCILRITWMNSEWSEIHEGSLRGGDCACVWRSLSCRLICRCPLATSLADEPCLFRNDVPPEHRGQLWVTLCLRLPSPSRCICRRTLLLSMQSVSRCRTRKRQGRIGIRDVDSERSRGARRSNSGYEIFPRISNGPPRTCLNISLQIYRKDRTRDGLGTLRLAAPNVGRPLRIAAVYSGSDMSGSAESCLTHDK